MVLLLFLLVVLALLVLFVLILFLCFLLLACFLLLLLFPLFERISHSFFLCLFLGGLIYCHKREDCDDLAQRLRGEPNLTFLRNFLVS